jgi:hypothetical protein
VGDGPPLGARNWRTGLGSVPASSPPLYGCPVTELRLHGRVVQTVFDLLGANEDDVTYSLGWALSQSDDLAYALLGEFFAVEAGELRGVRLQTSIPGAGRTDIEIEAEHAHLILEAKRGWEVESEGKLATYATRFEKDKSRGRVAGVGGMGDAPASGEGCRHPGPLRLLAEGRQAR